MPNLEMRYTEMRYTEMRYTEMRYTMICNHGRRRRVRRCAVGKSWAMGQAHRPSRAPSVRGPAQLAVRTRSRRSSLRWNLVPLTLRGCQFRRQPPQGPRGQHALCSQLEGEAIVKLALPGQTHEAYLSLRQ